MEILLTNTGTYKVKRVKVNGKDFLVAPMTILVPGVLAGSKGKLYYPREEAEKNYPVWNGFPLVVDHPTLNGKPVSARMPEIWASKEIGRFYNARINQKTGAIQGLGWFDEQRTKEVEPVIYQNLLMNKPLEVSTGVFTTNFKHETRYHDGIGYNETATNYRPDHIAILPFDQGACSNEDGCGVLVGNALTLNEFMESMGSMTSETEDDKEDAKEGEKNSKEKIDCKCKCKKNGECACKCVEAEDKEDKEDAAEDSSEESVNNKDQGVKAMEKSQLVEWLVTNCDCWKNQGDKEVLNAMSEDKLKVLKTNAVKAKESLELVANLRKEVGIADDVKDVVGFVKEKTKAVKADKKEEAVTNKDNDKGADKKDQVTTMPFQEYLSKHGTEQEKAVWNNAVEALNQQTANLCEQLTANISDESARKKAHDIYAKMPYEQLKELASAIPVNNRFSGVMMPTAPVYGLAGGGMVNNSRASDEDKPEPLGLPGWNWDDK